MCFALEQVQREHDAAVAAIGRRLSEAENVFRGEEQRLLAAEGEQKATIERLCNELQQTRTQLSGGEEEARSERKRREGGEGGWSEKREGEGKGETLHTVRTTGVVLTDDAGTGLHTIHATGIRFDDDG